MTALLIRNVAAQLAAGDVNLVDVLAQLVADGQADAVADAALGRLMAMEDGAARGAAAAFLDCLADRAVELAHAAATHRAPGADLPHFLRKQAV